MSRESIRDDKAALKLALTLGTGALAAKRKAAEALLIRAIDVHDIRAAQPALCIALRDDDVVLRRLAMKATCERVMGAGADVRIAFPTLHILCSDPDTEVRLGAWEAVSMADKRHLALLPRFVSKARQFAQDESEEIAGMAKLVLQKATDESA